jgi:hypothetical protein
MSGCYSGWTCWTLALESKNPSNAHVKRQLEINFLSQFHFYIYFFELFCAGSGAISVSATRLQGYVQLAGQWLAFLIALVAPAAVSDVSGCV